MEEGAEYGAVLGWPASKDPNRRRNVAVAVAATAAVLLVALAALLGGPGRRRDGLLQADLDDIAHRATFCGAFDDPVQCLRDHISSRHRYWTAKEVREELWTTMKGLAELEMKAGEKSMAKGQAADEQAKLLVRLRARLHKELAEIHDVQDKLTAKHSKGMEGISGDLVEAAKNVKELTDKGANALKDKMQVIQNEEDSKDQMILAEINAQVQNVSAALEQAHAKGLQEAAEVQSLVQAVQLEMQDSDTNIMKQLDAERVRSSMLAEREQRQYDREDRNETREAGQEDDDFVESLPQKLREGSRLILSNLTSGLDSLEQLIGGLLHPGILAAGKDVDELAAEQKGGVSALEGEIASMVLANQQSDSAIGGAAAKLRREQQEAAFNAQRRAAELASRIVEIGEDVVTAQQVLSTAQRDVNSAVESGLTEGVDRVERVRLAAVATISKGVKEMSQRLSEARAQLGEASSNLGKRQSADVERLTAFVRQAISQLNASLAASTVTASSEAEGMLAQGEAAQERAQGKLGEELRGQSRGMKAGIAAAHEKVGATEAKETFDMKVLGREGAAAGETTRELAATLRRAIDDTKARLEAAKLRVVRERRADASALSGHIKEHADELDAAVNATGKKDEADVARDVEELLEDVGSRLGGVEREARKAKDDAASQIAAANASDESATAVQVRQLGQALGGSRQDAGEISSRVTGLRKELDVEVAGLSKALSEAGAKRASDEAVERSKILASVESLSSELFSGLSEQSSTLATRVAGNVQRSLELIAEVGASLSQLEERMKLIAREARKGERAEDNKAKAEQGRLRQVAEELKNEAASEIDKLHSLLSSAAAHLAVVRREAASERSTSTSAIKSEVDSGLQQLDFNVTDVLALQSRELGAVVAHGVEEVSGRLDVVERTADSEESVVRGDVERMEQRQMRDDDDEREAMLGASKQVKIAQSDASSSSTALYQQVAATQKTLTETESSLRKLLDDHWIALTDQIRASLTAKKTQLLGSLGTDRQRAREVFAGDVVSINDALARLSNDTAADDLAMQAVLGEAAGEEQSNHGGFERAIGVVNAEQRRHKEELDALFARLQGGLKATNDAVAALRLHAGKREGSDYAEAGAKIAGDLGDEKAALESSETVAEADLRGRLASDGQLLSQRLAMLRSQVAREDADMGSRLGGISKVSDAEDAQHRSQIAKLFADGRGTANSSRVYYAELSGAIEEAEARLSASMHALEGEREDNAASLRARIETAVSALHDLQRRVASETGLSVASLKSSVAILDTEQGAARQELRAKEELSRQAVSSLLQQGLASAEKDEEEAVKQAAADTAADLAAQVKRSGSEVEQVSTLAADDMAKLRDRLGALSAAADQSYNEEDKRVAALERMNDAQAQYALTDVAKLNNMVKNDEERLMLLRAAMGGEVRGDITALRRSVGQTVGAAKEKMEHDLAEAVAAAQARANTGAEQFRQHAALVRSGAEGRARDVAKELAELEAREAQHVKDVEELAAAQAARVGGLANSTRRGVASIDAELDELSKNIGGESDAVRGEGGDDKEEISQTMQRAVAEAQRNLTRSVGDASAGMTRYMDAMIATARARLSDEDERLEAMGDNLNGTIKATQLGSLALIDESALNVSYVSTSMETAVGALTRRVDAAEAAYKGLKSQQSVGHGKSMASADELAKRAEALAERQAKTSRLVSKIAAVKAALADIMAKEGESYGAAKASLEVARSSAEQVRRGVKRGYDEVQARLKEEVARRQASEAAVGLLLTQLKRDIQSLSNQAKGAKKPEGDRGAPGPLGPAGPKGMPGPRGDQGSPGLPGERGPLGPVGGKGAQGALGSPGAEGDKGVQGAVGVVGPAGPVGPAGENGIRGDVGKAGAMGAPGRPGRAGGNGAAGLKGRKGEQGDTGNPGDVGISGPPGSPGQAAQDPNPPAPEEQDDKEEEGGEEEPVKGGVNPEFEVAKGCFGVKGKVCKAPPLRDVCRSEDACGCIPKTCDCGEFDCIKAGGKEKLKKAKKQSKRKQRRQK